MSKTSSLDVAIGKNAGKLDKSGLFHISLNSIEKVPVIDNLP